MSFDENNGFATAKEIEDAQTVQAELVEDNVENNDVPIKVDVTANMTVNGELPDYAILNPQLPMRVKIGVAGEVASCLKEVIQSQGLIVKGLGGNKNSEYVTIEGWEVLGTMLGIVPVTEIITDITNKQGRTVGYEARATLYRNPILDKGEIVGGEMIARAEASADKSGFQKDLPSIRSMAQTRALGKCYRMALSWIIKMAGYEGTPANEMPDYKG